jgi:hypothetical protein
MPLGWGPGGPYVPWFAWRGWCLRPACGPRGPPLVETGRWEPLRHKTRPHPQARSLGYLRCSHTVWPRSTTTAWPLAKAASPEHSHSTAAAISSGLPMRRSVGTIVEPVQVATAVAPSAASPLLLPAIERTFTFERDGQRRTEAVLVVDGGVYDNLGLSVLEPGRSSMFTPHVYDAPYIVSCDAGRGELAMRSPTSYSVGSPALSMPYTDGPKTGAALDYMNGLRRPYQRVRHGVPRDARRAATVPDSGSGFHAEPQPPTGPTSRLCLMPTSSCYRTAGNNSCGPCCRCIAPNSSRDIQRRGSGPRSANPLVMLTVFSAPRSRPRVHMLTQC